MGVRVCGQFIAAFNVGERKIVSNCSDMPKLTAAEAAEAITSTRLRFPMREKNEHRKDRKTSGYS